MREVGNIRFSEDHLWARLEEDGRVTIGISDFLQEDVGEIYNINLPDEGEELIKDEAFSILEAQSGRRELLAPLSGEVVEVNYELNDVPELVNEDPYEEGWILRLDMTAPGEFNELLTEEEYEEYLKEEEEDFDFGEEYEEDEYLEEDEDE
ncbi:MAG: glycine cleavage system protein H [Desulfobacca sp.]|uniref:glycine cleavage system protein H n=1 Tax=Desulfobacca sp. TaxID=2067990 RepID=UPI0040493DDE